VPTPALVFYYRNGCHLCEEMAAVLFRGWPQQAAAMEWRDVDQRADWRAAYGERIPVLMQGDDIVCVLRADPARIAEYFGPGRDPL
jgi:hypothetical protein